MFCTRPLLSLPLSSLSREAVGWLFVLELKLVSVWILGMPEAGGGGIRRVSGFGVVVGAE